MGPVLFVIYLLFSEQLMLWASFTKSTGIPTASKYTKYYGRGISPMTVALHRAARASYMFHPVPAST